MPRLEVAKGEIRFDSVIIDIDENSGKAINIKNISKILN